MKTEISGNGPWAFSITAMTHNENDERVPVGDIPMDKEAAKTLCADYDIMAELQSGGHCFTFKATTPTFEVIRDMMT